MKYLSAYEALQNLLKDNPELLNQQVQVSARGLKTEEAIGKPERQDFPLLTGREVLLQAEIGSYKGQAFTADPLSFEGSLKQVLSLSQDRPGHLAITIAVLNALAVSLGIADRTIHCHNNEPEECAREISNYLLDKHGHRNIGIIGYQPAILENCVKVFGPEHVHITDLNPDNIGQTKHGVKVWDGLQDTRRLIDFADVLLITGTVLANGTFTEMAPLLNDKKVYFFGTTAAAMAPLNNFSRLCFRGQ